MFLSSNSPKFPEWANDKNGFAPDHGILSSALVLPNLVNFNELQTVNGSVEHCPKFIAHFSQTMKITFGERPSGGFPDPTDKKISVLLGINFHSLNTKIL